MNWDAIGAIGEIIGALAVVLSLVYLAIQIRIQNVESREASMHVVAESFRESASIFGDPQLAEILAKTNGGSELTEVELIQLYVAGTQILRFWEEAHRLHLRERIDTELWEGMMKQFGAAFQLPALRRVWEARKDFYSYAFQQLVDGVESGTKPLEYR